MNYRKFVLILASGRKIENFALDSQTAISYVESWYKSKVISIEEVDSIYN